MSEDTKEKIEKGV